LLFTEIRNDYCQVEFVLLHSGSFVLSASTTSRYFLPSYSTAGYRTEAPTYYSTAASYFSAPSYASPSYKAEAESHYATTATYYTSTAYTTSGYYTTAGYYYESTAYFAYTTAAPHYDVAPNYGAESDHHEYEPLTKSSYYSAPAFTTDGYRYEEHGYHTTTSSYAYGPAPFTQAVASYYLPSDYYSPYDLESTPGRPMKNLLPTIMPAIYPRKLIHITQLLRRPTSRTLLNMTATKLRGTCKRVQLTTPQPNTVVQDITPPQLLPSQFVAQYLSPQAATIHFGQLYHCYT
jgi:hypothetical protein